ncbi:hypothetical protein BGW37DRAFT_557101 [Umbelopsis sp. PMI_123]|nr:hypothetical protein BGW37DRAFT_557101 [Umbelopsis sp. PMI_123]
MANNSTTSFGNVLSGGIQDISAIAALFGTELCSNHLINAMSSGYLYSAVSGISMFGSLGLIKAATEVVLPQTWLLKIGMQSSNKVLALSSSEQNSLTMLAMDTFGLPQLYVNHSGRQVEILRRWALSTILTAMFNFCGLLPFAVPLYRNRVNPYWGFVILRVASSVIGAATLPLAMQSMACGKIPVKIEDKRIEKNILIPLKLLKLLLVLASFGVLAGYIGCFTYVQNFNDALDVYTWLALEIVMMIVRMAVWAWDPKFDELPNIKINVKSDVRVCQPITIPLAAIGDNVIRKIEIFDYLPAAAVTRAAVHAGLMLREPVNFGLAAMSVKGKTYLLIVSHTIANQIKKQSLVMVYSQNEKIERYGWYCAFPSGIAICLETGPHMDEYDNYPEAEKWEQHIKQQTSLFDNILNHSTFYSYYNMELLLHLTGEFKLTAETINRYTCQHKDDLFKERIEKCACKACQQTGAGWPQSVLGSCITKTSIQKDTSSVSDSPVNVQQGTFTAHMSIPMGLSQATANENGNTLKNTIQNIGVNNSFGAGLWLKRYEDMSRDPDYSDFIEMIRIKRLLIPWPLMEDQMEKQIEITLQKYWNDSEILKTQTGIYSTMISLINYHTLKLEVILDPVSLEDLFLKWLTKPEWIGSKNINEVSWRPQRDFKNLEGKVFNYRSPKINWMSFGDETNLNLDQYFHKRWKKHQVDSAGVMAAWNATRALPEIGL